MADFSTGAELTVSVNQRSLSEARDTIQSELGDLEVGVDAVVSGNGGGPGGGRSEVEDLVQIETERWELDKRRNDYLEELVEGGGVVAAGAQQAAGGGGGGGGGILQALGLRSVLGGGAAGAGVTAGGLAAGGLATAGAGLVAGGALGIRQPGMEREEREMVNQQGLEQAQQVREQARSGEGLGDPETRRTMEERNPLNELPEFPDLSEQSWPDLPDLANESDWPSLPNLSQEFEWPDPPDLNPFDGDQQTQREAMTRSRRGPTQRGPNESLQSVEPTINLGGLTVDVTTEIDNAVDDAVDEVEDTVDDAVGDLERRVADAIGGFF
jgi:hypothetical protein